MNDTKRNSPSSQRILEGSGCGGTLYSFCCYSLYLFALPFICDQSHWHGRHRCHWPQYPHWIYGSNLPWPWRFCWCGSLCSGHSCNTSPFSLLALCYICRGNHCLCGRGIWDSIRPPQTPLPDHCHAGRSVLFFNISSFHGKASPRDQRALCCLVPPSLDSM